MVKDWKVKQGRAGCEEDSPVWKGVQKPDYLREEVD